MDLIGMLTEGLERNWDDLESSDPVTVTNNPF